MFAISLRILSTTSNFDFLRGDQELGKFQEKGNTRVGQGRSADLEDAAPRASWKMIV